MVTLTLYLKFDASNSHELHYHDIGDYLSQKEKLNIISNLGDISSIDWKIIVPDENNDWINQRDKNFNKYKRLVSRENGVFGYSATGIVTSRDPWVYSFSKDKVLFNAKRLIENFNNEVEKLKTISVKDRKSSLNYDPKVLNWSEGLKKDALNLKTINHIQETKIISYRPFVKKHLYFGKELLHRPSKYYLQFGQENLTIVTTGNGSNKDFGVLITNCIPDYQFMMNGQGFMRYDNKENNSLLEFPKDNMNQSFSDELGLSLDDTFAYVYGLLNSREYQKKYANDLKKDLARIPIVKNIEKYVEIGKELMDLHLNYEEVPLYKEVEVNISKNPSYKVTKMKFAKKRDENGKSVNDLSTIIFNNDITISNIPEKAYEYVVNGRSAIEWIIDQYQVKTDKKSGITDDPNDYSDDEKYIFNLLLRIINVSIQTVDLINSLPKLEIDE